MHVLEMESSGSMYILAIETTGPVGSVALIPVSSEDGSPEKGSEAGDAKANGPSSCDIPMKVTTRTMSHLKNLMKMTEDLFDESGIGKDEIAAVAVSVGPGSFTGIRIGVSTGRALAEAWDVPCVSVPTLTVFREKCGIKDGDRTDGSVAVIFNARRGQVYAACYDADGNEVVEPGPYMLEDVLGKIEGSGLKPLFYGDGIDAYMDKPEYHDRLAKYGMTPREERYQTAKMVARAAKTKFDAHDTCGYGTLLPDYMRESEAEQRLKDGSLEQMRKAKLERLMHA